MEIRPFKIEIPQTVLDDLHERLARTRWPDEIANSNSEYGISLSYMKQLVSYWQDEFDWRAQEQELNSLDNLRAEVDGLAVHFIHQRGKGPNPLPLIITHGWPGSFVEMLKIIPLLTDPVNHGGDAANSFDVVVPSLPGYGFSDRPVERGMNAFRIAGMWLKLMEGLGYQKFAAQGGDWGASVSTCLGFKYPEKIIGLHLNYIPGSYKPYLGPGSKSLSDRERDFLQEQQSWVQTNGGYAHLQSTTPQTAAYGLNDSPVGLASWIIEKFHDWSDADRVCFSKDELLTNVMIYWATETIHSSMRLYKETQNRPLHFAQGERVLPPCAVLRLAKEAPFPPREWVERCYNVRQWTEFPTGGHFAALEEPDALVEDIRNFFRPLRSK